MNDCTVYDLRNRIIERQTVIDTICKDAPYEENISAKNNILIEELSMAMKNIVECTNRFGSSSDVMAKGLFDGIINSHRHLQSEYFIVLGMVLKMYSETEYVDGRNEWAKDMAKRMIEGNEKI